MWGSDRAGANRRGGVGRRREQPQSKLRVIWYNYFKGRWSNLFKKIKKTNMIRGNFLGAAMVATIYTIYILMHPLATKAQTAAILVVLNALTIVLMAFAFKS